MGSVDLKLASGLRDALGVRRAVETGTYRGITARSLAGVFERVVTIELSTELHRTAQAALSDVPAVTATQGHSVEVLKDLEPSDSPTLYFLDVHWSGGLTAGAEDECPVLQEIAAIGDGNPDDCLIVDDADLFMAPPPPPHKPEAWPTLLEVVDAVRAHHPGHHITLLGDQIIAVPAKARGVVDAHGQALREGRAASLSARAEGVATVVREWIATRR